MEGVKYAVKKVRVHLSTLKGDLATQLINHKTYREIRGTMVPDLDVTNIIRYFMSWFELLNEEEIEEE
jgi:hypothetical protein